MDPVVKHKGSPAASKDQAPVTVPFHLDTPRPLSRTSFLNSDASMDILPEDELKLHWERQPEPAIEAERNDELPHGEVII